MSRRAPSLAPAPMTRRGPRRRRFLAGVCLAAVAAAAAAGCRDGSMSYLQRLGEARRLATDLRVHFSQAADASNRAVMADTDEASRASAKEAALAKEAVQRDLDALAPHVGGLGLASGPRLLQEFHRRFAEYQALDRTVLELAVENTNLKAQRLSFGPAREAADTFRAALDAVAGAAPPATRCRVQSLVADAVLAVREIQVLHGPHIAEAEDAPMTRMEQEMAAREATARGALGSLSGLVSPASRAQLAAASEALERFKATHEQILALSRKNTNVRSLALAIGQLRPLAAACDAGLKALQDAVAKEGIEATR